MPINKKYFGLKIKQRSDINSPEFVILVANAKDVSSWAGIRRVGEVEKGIQRVLKPPRVTAIRRFFESNAKNTIPVSAVIAFNPGTVTFNAVAGLDACTPETDNKNGIGTMGEWGTISFDFDPDGPEQDRPAIIVDGQHRIRGMAAFNEEIPLPIAAFINSDPQEQAFQFVVINNKAQKVPTENVKAIIKDIDEQELQMRLLKAGVSYGKYPATLGDIDESEESPFYKLLDWPLNQTTDKLVQLTTIESCLRYIRETLPILSEDEDSLKSLFISIWSSVKSSYPALWKTNEKFFSKVNILALNEFIIDKLENGWIDKIVDVYLPENVSEYTKKSLEDISAEFWQTEWLNPLQDNAVIRGRIKDDLRKIPQNKRAGREWYDGLKLVAQP